MKKQEEQKYIAQHVVLPEDLTSCSFTAFFLSPLCDIESYNLTGKHLIQNEAGS